MEMRTNTKNTVTLFDSENSQLQNTLSTESPTLGVHIHFSDQEECACCASKNLHHQR